MNYALATYAVITLFVFCNNYTEFVECPLQLKHGYWQRLLLTPFWPFLACKLLFLYGKSIWRYWH